MMRSLIFAFVLWILICGYIDAEECSNTKPCPIVGGEPLPRCEELVSKDGVLDVVLNVEVGIFEFEWLKVPRRSYNGSQCPKTWRVKKGDTLNVLLINNLSDDNPPALPNKLGGLNTTNLHTHGLHISSKEPQDNVFVKVEPGQRYQYSYKILNDHPSGSFWYHAHAHGSTTLQVSSGMAGFLIVDDDPEDPSNPSELQSVSCPGNCQHDIPIIFSSMTMMKKFVGGQNGDNLRLNETMLDDGDNLENWLSKNVNYIALNGKILPTITFAKNQMTRLRLLNAGNSLILELKFVRENGDPAPCEVREIATDGIYYDEPRNLKHGQIVLLVANRKDVLIKCSEEGTFKLVSLAENIHALSYGGGRRINIDLATVNIEGNSSVVDVSFPTSLPQRPYYVTDLRDATPDQTIVIEVGANNFLNRDIWKGPEDFRYKVEVDSIVEVQLTSTDYPFGHPIHFHINHLQVISYNEYVGPVTYYQFMNPISELRDVKTGKKCDYQDSGYKDLPLPFNTTDPLKYLGHEERWEKNGNNTLGYTKAGDWVDTVFSPGLSNITLRMMTDRFTGVLQIHCHLPADADTGMTMVIEVVEKGGDLSGARIDAEGSYPGTCMKCDWNRYKPTPIECYPIYEHRDKIFKILSIFAGLVLAGAGAFTTI